MSAVDTTVSGNSSSCSSIASFELQSSGGNRRKKAFPRFCSCMCTLSRLGLRKVWFGSDCPLRMTDVERLTLNHNGFALVMKPESVLYRGTAYPNCTAAATSDRAA
jgi:hypothetical protein